MISETDLLDLKNIIYNNPNIDVSIKDKIFECAGLIIKKYPFAYRNLYANLEHITIDFSDNIESDLLKRIELGACFIPEENTLLFNEEINYNEFYQHIIVHELIHVASTTETNMGFQSIYDDIGLSLNEGMTEFLTYNVLENSTDIMEIYQSDFNNILLLSCIIPVNILINLYFKDGLYGLLKEYINNVGDTNNIKEIMSLMDKDFEKRTLKNTFYNQYKDQYISLFINDVSKIEFNNEDELNNVARLIKNFIIAQYKKKNIPSNVITSFENCIIKISNNGNKL